MNPSGDDRDFFFVINKTAISSIPSVPSQFKIKIKSRLFFFSFKMS